MIWISDLKLTSTMFMLCRLTNKDNATLHKLFGHGLLTALHCSNILMFIMMLNWCMLCRCSETLQLLYKWTCTGIQYYKSYSQMYTFCKLLCSRLDSALFVVANGDLHREISLALLDKWVMKSLKQPCFTHPLANIDSWLWCTASQCYNRRN